MADEIQGQVPPVPAPVAAPVAQVAPGDTTHETANQEAARYRTERNALKKRLDALEADTKARQDSDLSELQKAQKRAAELETAHATVQTRARNAELRAAGLVLGGKLGVPADRLNLLVKLLQVDGGDVEFDEDGNPQKDSLERVLRGILKENPILVPTPTDPAAPVAPAPIASGSPTNAPRVVSVTYTPEQIGAMSPAEYAANRDKIHASLNGR